MALRRPLVRVGGRSRQLPVGDLIPADVVDLQQYTPAFTAGGVMLRLRHASYGVLQAFTADGHPLNLKVMNNGG